MRAKQMHKLPVTLAPGNSILLPPGDQNELIKLTVEQFCSRCTPGGDLLYLGDAEKKWIVFRTEKLADGRQWRG